jgi:hypothetical protein
LGNGSYLYYVLEAPCSRTCPGASSLCCACSWSSRFKSLALALYELELLSGPTLFADSGEALNRCVASKGLRYAVESYFATLDWSNVDAELTNSLRSLWDTRNLDARTLLLQQAERQQLSVVEDRHPRTMGELWMAASAGLMAEDCGGYAGIDRGPTAGACTASPAARSCEVRRIREVAALRAGS